HASADGGAAAREALRGPSPRIGARLPDARPDGDELPGRGCRAPEGGRKNGQKKRCNTRTSQEVTHPSTTLAQARLTAEF
ncbi:hypothetical protein PIB30_115043, partial [Stylosanthes scabra]|nr:hypothetical protein [Stylosanthes scabra]